MAKITRENYGMQDVSGVRTRSLRYRAGSRRTKRGGLIMTADQLRSYMMQALNKDTWELHPVVIP